MIELKGVVTSPAQIIASVSTKNEINVEIVGSGARGKSGEDGHTPIKGVDYYTEEDIAEIVRRIVDVVKDDAELVHDQISASNVWVINHDLDKYPSVSVVDTANNLVMGDVKYTSRNTVVLTFTAEFSGKAFLN